MTRPHPKVLGSGVRGLCAAVLAAAGISGAVTLTAAMLPQRHFVSRPPLLHVALETAASLIALLADFLVFGRLLRQGRLNDLLNPLPLCPPLAGAAHDLGTRSSASTRSTHSVQTVDICPGSAYQNVFRHTSSGVPEAQGEKGGRDAIQVRCA
jgi:hypothetical protein